MLNTVVESTSLKALKMLSSMVNSMEIPLNMVVQQLLKMGLLKMSYLKIIVQNTAEQYMLSAI